MRFLARLSTATPSSEPCKRVENSARGRASVPTAVLEADSHQDSPLDGWSHGLGTGERHGLSLRASSPGRPKSGWLQGCASPAPSFSFPPCLWVVSWTFSPPALSSGTPASPSLYRGCEIMQPGLADRKGQQLFSCPQADAHSTGASCLSLLGGRESGMGPQLYPQTPEQSTREQCSVFWRSRQEFKQILSSHISWM